MTKEELKRARLRLGLTQGELAEALGMQLNSISRMELGNQPVMRVTGLAVRYLLVMSKKSRRKK